MKARSTLRGLQGPNMLSKHVIRGTICRSCKLANSSLMQTAAKLHTTMNSNSNSLRSSSSNSRSSCRPRVTCSASITGGQPAAGADGQQAVIEPFTEDELKALTEIETGADTDALGEAWRSEFEDDIDGLYDYVDRGHMDVADQIEDLHAQPKHLWEQLGLLEKLEKFPAGLVADMMGMGSWRLKGIVDEVFEFMVTRIEGSLRELLETDLALYPAEKWKARGWDFVDSMDPNREWDGFSYVDMPSPLKGMEGYPRMLIENRVYSSRVFRKLHLEVAYRQDGLQVLHIVFFPRYDFDIPILALDLVAAGGAVTLAIIDACPVTPRLSLPQHYLQTMMELQQNFLPESCQSRSIPPWGEEIFSPLCVCIRPNAPEDLAGFMKYAVALTRAHLMYSQLLEPLSPDDKPSARRLSQLLACHKRFCDNQLANTKTARALEVSFEKEFTDAYMKELMFDFNPREDVPWFDGSLAKLYEYFENTPEVWANAAHFMKTRLQLDEDKASNFLRRFLAGDPSIKLPRLSFAMQHMYDYDEDFQAAVDRSLIDKHIDDIPAPAEMGEYLAKQLMEMVGLQQQQQQQGSSEDQDQSVPDLVVGEEGVERVLDREVPPGSTSAPAGAADNEGNSEQQQGQQWKKE